MARIRSIKPDFFSSEAVSGMPLRARLTWVGLWTQCDDHGRAKDNARLIKAAVWPLDNTSLSDIEEDLVTLADHGRIVRYSVDGKGFLAVVNWHEHQAISKPSKARFPAPPVLLCTLPGADSGHCPTCYADFMAQPVDNTGAEAETAGQTRNENTSGMLPEPSGSPPGTLPLGKERKGREGTRARTSAGTVTDPSGSQPPLKCPTHQHDPAPPPCGACADARRAHDAWAKSRPTLSVIAHDCPEHPGQPAGRCDTCACSATPPPRGWRKTNSTLEPTP